MKNLILVAVILSSTLIYTAYNQNYEFGDIIKFPRKCNAIIGKPLYNHYAIYVGPESGVNISQGDNDIVHRGGVKEKPGCNFGQLRETVSDGRHEKFNFLDGIKKDNNSNFTPGTNEEIRARIIEFMRNCPPYHLIKNNCEHFATKVRYNYTVTMQVGSCAQLMVVLSSSARELLKKIKADRDMEAACKTSS